MWDPEVYGRYADHRSRPFHELVRRVRAEAPRSVVDLGCGDGSLTATLAERWPSAAVLGLDSSESMLAGAPAGPRLRFAVGRIEEWVPDGPVDVLVSNAALQWVPSQLDLLPRLVGTLAPGGWLAVQVPGNWAEPTHTLLAGLRESPRWRSRLADAGRGPEQAPPDPAGYVRLLAGLGCAVDAWETTYAQVLTGPDPVLGWARGTALRPVLAALSAADAAEFEAEYGVLLREAYPARPYGTVLPFRRIFAVAQVAG
jgi:trans-aconitate 2-methyltransferase